MSSRSNRASEGTVCWERANHFIIYQDVVSNIHVHDDVGPADNPNI